MFSHRQNIKELSDAELISNYKETDDGIYLGELFERYSHLVFGLCLKHLKNEAESKDAVINIFEKLMKDLKQHEVKYFKSWLYMVTKNHCLMYLRNLQAQTKKELELIRSETPVMGVAYENDDQTSQEKEIQNLEKAIESLKPGQKECIKLFFIQEKCYYEVADITGFSLKEVKSYIQNGKRNLKILLTKRAVAANNN
jgi:RNA polymerase sigma-70 factor, ECF subfamily